MIGAIIGDIVGSIYEFDNIKTKEFPLFGEDCEYTDDSVLTFAVADALLHSGDFSNFSEACRDYLYRYAEIFKDPMGGYGTRFIVWVASGGKEPYYSCGNGSAMRCSPVAYAANTLREAEDLAEQSAVVTHNHPEGIKGAKATAAATFLALHGTDKDLIRDYIAEEYYPQIRNMSTMSIRPHYHFESTCQETVPQAFVAFYEAENFEDAIRNGISLGGDSDTLCAITGAIAGAYFGVPDNIRNKAISYLPEMLKDVLHDFEMKYPGIPENRNA